ncbi:hypothetical protein KSP39_PZI009386 [Platanthera zijinensis]|uniref:Uncharacterized protein n=1 Tax=Platanthera zijinensis TaxID=2320716 RepID=A0AAP0BK04_9ASPA
MGKYAVDKQEEQEESLSFATMACHVSHSPETISQTPSPPGDPFFEFQTSPESSYPASPADVLFSNGILLPNSLSPENGETGRRRCLKDPFSHRSGSRKLTISASKRVAFQQAEARTPPPMEERPLRPIRNYNGQGHRAVAPERKKAKGRLGMLGFFRATCRECKALEPSSQVMEIRSLPAQSAGGYNNGRKVNRRPGRRPDNVLFELDLK